MSLYTCIDLLGSQLDQLSKEESVVADQEFLSQLKEQLNQRITDDNYTDFSTDIALIETYQAENQHNKIKKCLKFIVDELNELTQRSTIAAIQKFRLEYLDVTGFNANLPGYKKFQTPEYLIAPIEQGELVKMGTSSGYCYGFTYAMVNPKLSPYKNPGMEIDLNQDVHNYQKSQDNRQKDQQSIKRTRLTRTYFCPDAQEQARQILNVAETNKGKELALILTRKVSGHACYLSVQDDGKIRYMDPNYGAFLFHCASDFIDLYVAAAQSNKEAGYVYPFYYLSEMNYDEHGQLTESKTWQGKIRTLLTGPKYDERSLSLVPFVIAVLIFDMTLSAGIVCGIGSILGAIIGSVVPIVGTAFGAEVGGFLGVLLGALAGELLCFIALNNDYQGLLGIPHMLQDYWHRFKEKRTSSSSSNSNDSKAVAMNECPINCSASKVLSLLDVDSPTQQSVVAEEDMRSTEFQQNRGLSVVITSPRGFFKRNTVEPIDQASTTISMSC